jgi:hypothetical protein
MDGDRYSNYETLACDLCKTCDHNTKEHVSEGLNGVSEKEYPFCNDADLHMVWMKAILEKTNDCYRYTHDGVT